LARGSFTISGGSQGQTPAGVKPDLEISDLAVKNLTLTTGDPGQWRHHDHPHRGQPQLRRQHPQAGKQVKKLDRLYKKNSG
jgi:hypothetical protein